MAAASGLFVVGLVSAGVAWATLLTPQPVVTAKGRQFQPAAAPAGANLAYSQSRSGHPSQFDVYVKPAGLPRYKVNKRGQAQAGGIDGTTLIYQTIRNGQSNLRLFDLVSCVRSTPAGVNTKRWEYRPTISGDWILFGRIWSSHPANFQVMLHNTNTAETRVLAERINRRHSQLDAGQVNGDFATWDQINFQTPSSNVFLYQISTAATTRIPEPTGKLQYYPAVTPTGDVFYVRSGNGCGNHVVLREYSSGIDTPVAVLPSGYDVFKTFAVDEGGGETSLYFDRYQCSTGKSHIYKITVS
jgi:Tol biopolymer transport system component